MSRDQNSILFWFYDLLGSISSARRMLLYALIENPPSMLYTLPVTMAASSEARNTTTPAIYG